MSNRVGVNLRASAYLHQGDRKYMEDEFQVAYQRTVDKKDIEYAFFGIFDGHGGKEAAHFAKDHLMDNIVSQKSFWSEDDESVLTAIKEGFLLTHHAMWKVLDQWPRTASGWPSTSGTTASVAFIRRQKIYVGHVGDSGIVLGYETSSTQWKGEALTKDHKPGSASEKTRINDCGGKVINKAGVPRVVWNRPKVGHQGPVRRSTPIDEIPFLAVARSLGDLWSYNPSNDEFVVSPIPDVFVMPIDISCHRCLIFGTDGLWNVLSPDAAVDMVYATERSNEKHYLGIPMACGKQRLWMNPSRSVVWGALDCYQRLSLRADNTSAVTVFLDPPGQPKREVLLQQDSLKKGLSVKSKKPVSEDGNLPEASVKVHVYNQNHNDPYAANRRIIPIQERLPENWQNTSAFCPDPDDGLLIDPNKKNGCLDNRLPLCCVRGDTVGGKTGSAICDWVRSAAKCEMATTSKKEDNNRLIDHQDPIQIPVVSSSTPSSSDSSNSTEHDDIQSFENCHAHRKTRSCVPHTTSVNDLKADSSNGWTGLKECKTPRKGRLRTFSVPDDSSSRVLKSVNRSGDIDNSFSLSRKRRAEAGQDLTCKKSARVNTRLHTWTHKSMVTRSQERTMRK